MNEPSLCRRQNAACKRQRFAVAAGFSLGVEDSRGVARSLLREWLNKRHSRRTGSLHASNLATDDPRRFSPRDFSPRGRGGVRGLPAEWRSSRRTGPGRSIGFVERDRPNVRNAGSGSIRGPTRIVAHFGRFRLPAWPGETGKRTESKRASQKLERKRLVPISFRHMVGHSPKAWRQARP